MNNDNIIKDVIGLLTKEQTQFLKKWLLEANITDFAVLLGGNCNRYEKIWEDELAVSTATYKCIEGGQGDWWLNDIEGDKVSYVDGNGCLRKDYCDNRFIGLRPTICYKSISSLISNMKKQDSIKFVEYGNYPQYLCSNAIKRKLERKYKKGKFKETGNYYTVNGSTNKKFTPMALTEYEYKGEKYIRYIYTFEANKMLSNKEITRLNNVYWLKVEPIEWIVIEKYDICIASNILCANISFSDFKWFLNTYFLKEIVHMENNQEYLDDDLKLNNTIEYNTRVNLTYLISERYQRVVLLLEKLKDYDFYKYMSLKKELDEVIDKSAAETNNIVSNGEVTLYLYCKESIDKNILNNLIRLETKIELILKLKQYAVNCNVNNITNSITNIINSLEKNDIKNLDEIDKISELFLKNIDNISFENQIDISKKISLIYLLIIKNNNIDSQKLENNAYVSYFKRYLYLLIRELVENNNIIINTHINPYDGNDINLDEIIKMINNIEFVSKETKKLILLK